MIKEAGARLELKDLLARLAFTELQATKGQRVTVERPALRVLKVCKALLVTTERLAPTGNQACNSR